MITFGKFNETANYYSRTSRTTGRNVWNQDEIQRQFSELIVNCDLTKEQVTSLEGFMIGDNATIDMAPTRNKSVQAFNETVKAREDVFQKSRVA